MAQEIQEHEHEMHHEHMGNSMGFLIGLILLVVALFLIFYLLSPAFRTPVRFSIPGTININLHQTK